MTTNIICKNTYSNLQPNQCWLVHNTYATMSVLIYLYIYICINKHAVWPGDQIQWWRWSIDIYTYLIIIIICDI